MKDLTHHSCRLIGSPWPGVFATDTDSAYTYDRHWHSTFGFGFMERGAHRSMSGRGTVNAYEGEVITSNPGEVHDGRPLGAPSRRWRMIYLEPNAMASMTGGAEPAVLDVELTRPVFQDRTLLPQLRRLFSRLERWNTASNTWGDGVLACEESLVEACGLLLHRHSSASLPQDAPADIRQARERLADDVVNTPSLSELAALVGLSKYQLLRRFERVYGVTPHRWLRALRIERARASIRIGASLAGVAAQCGFADQSHMTRAFVEHFGFTPGEWRKAAVRRTSRE